MYYSSYAQDERPIAGVRKTLPTPVRAEGDLRAEFPPAKYTRSLIVACTRRFDTGSRRRQVERAVEFRVHRQG